MSKNWPACDRGDGRPSQHRIGLDGYLCCECFVKDGNAPADWHTNCMRTYRELKADPVEVLKDDTIEEPLARYLMRLAEQDES